MKCYVAIPSKRDVDGGSFRRLGRWNQRSEIIQVNDNGNVLRTNADQADPRAILWIVSPFFLDDESEARKLLLNGTQLKSGLGGVFLHPGITNTPGTKEVQQFLNKKLFSNQNAKDTFERNIVAFTISGNKAYHVRCLGLIWNYLQQTENSQTECPRVSRDELHTEYLRLKGQGSKERLVLLCVLAQGILEKDLSNDVKNRFKEDFLKVLTWERSWMVAVPKSLLSFAVKEIPETQSPDKNWHEALVKFLEAAREYLKIRSSKSEGESKQ